MSILGNAYSSVFGSKPATPPAAPTAAPGVTPNQTPSTPPANTDSAVPQDNKVAPAPPPPLADFTKLWETPVADPKAPAPPKSFLENVTAENIAKAAGAVDFSKIVSQDLVADITAGGEKGVQALLKALNGVAQDVYAKSATASTTILKKALEEHRGFIEDDLPTKIRESSIRGSAKARNPILDNPALRPLTNALETQFATQYPEATADQVAEMVEDYWHKTSKFLTAASTPTPTKTTRGEPDWDEFAGL